MSVMIKTNLGEIPEEDYLEIMAMNYGFDSYEDLKEQGYYIDTASLVMD